ncbi:MAG: hypothetical protein WA138_04445 [Parvibaculum sp.]
MTITPSAHLAALYPPRTAFASISQCEDMPALLYNDWQMESISGTVLSCLGAMPGCAHRNVASEIAFDFFRKAGIEPPSALDIYDDRQGAIAAARRLAEAGQRLACIYPHLPEIRKLNKTLVPAEIYNYLNDKRNLAALCPSAFAPPRRIFNIEEARNLQADSFAFPLFFKGALDGANGGGRDVHYCKDRQGFDAALQWFLSMPFFKGLVIEEPISIASNWCLNFSILDNDVRYFGAAEQTFEAIANQSGSVIDPKKPAPAQAIEIGHEICLAAQARGYRGIVGMDMCVDTAGKIYFFDLNFRVNSCTNLILLHEGMEDRRRISTMYSYSPTGKLSDLMMSLDEMISRGQFIPLQLYDGAAHQGASAPCRITGFFRSDTRGEGEALVKEAGARLQEKISVPG